MQDNILGCILFIFNASAFDFIYGSQIPFFVGVPIALGFQYLPIILELDLAYVLL